MKIKLNLKTLAFFIVAILLISCNKNPANNPAWIPSTPGNNPPSSPNPPSSAIACDSSRPHIIATLVSVGKLSSARWAQLFAASAGNKILFAGGWQSTNHSSRVDIYDIVSNTWSTAELSEANRDGMAVATVGNKIFFAGGGDYDWVDVTSRVDIYDASSNTWSVAELSQPRRDLAATTLGNKVYFAGGGVWSTSFTGSNVVDIYDNATNTWSTAQLSEGRYELSATPLGNKIYFAGGLYSIFDGSKKIDIYDAITNTWTTSQLREVKASHAAIAMNNKIYWAAGANTSYQSGYKNSSIVEIKDITNGVSSFDCITPNVRLSPVIKNDNIIFFPSSNLTNQFDIYNTSTNNWTIGILPISIRGAAIISVNNVIYIAGGMVGNTLSDQVWKLEF
jgi:hypothetical protein